MATKRKATTSKSNGRKKKKVEEEEDEWFAGITTCDDIGPSLIKKIYHIDEVCQKSMFSHTKIFFSLFFLKRKLLIEIAMW